MTYYSGKAVSGGTPLSDEELSTLAKDQISALRSTFPAPKEIEKSDDVLELRMAEEMRLVERMLQMLQEEMRSRGNHRAADALQRSEEAIEDLAELVEADDRCEAIGNVDSDMARRLTRRTADGDGTPCDNRRPSILKADDGGR